MGISHGHVYVMGIPHGHVCVMGISHGHVYVMGISHGHVYVMGISHGHVYVMGISHGHVYVMGISHGHVYVMGIYHGHVYVMGISHRHVYVMGMKAARQLRAENLAANYTRLRETKTVTSPQSPVVSHTEHAMWRVDRESFVNTATVKEYMYTTVIKKYTCMCRKTEKKNVHINRTFFLKTISN